MNIKQRWECPKCDNFYESPTTCTTVSCKYGHRMKLVEGEPVERKKDKTKTKPKMTSSKGDLKQILGL